MTRRPKQTFGTAEDDLNVQVLDAIADMVLVKGPHSKILWANKVFRDFYGMSNEQLRGIVDAPFNEPDYTQQYVRDDAHVFDSGTVLDVPEEQVTRHDGVVRLVHTVKSPIHDASGKVVMIVGVIRDITESKKVEARLSTAARMASIGTLAAGVAHEINNPLMYAMGNVEHLSELMSAATRSSATTDDVKGLLDDVRAGLERVRLVVRGLQTFSRDDENLREAVPVARVVDWAGRLANNEIRYRARLEIDCRDSAVVDGNESQLGQVVLNLLVNAAHSIPEGHAENNLIRVITKSTDAGWTSIEVRDTGRGIRPDHLARLFDPFFTTKAVGEGTGLGLSIAHNIVQAHGGKIEIESKLGKGSTFRVLLPPSTTRMKQDPPKVEALTQGRRGRVMVIDDEPAILSVVRRALASAHDVFAFNNAASALASLTEGARFDVILCDLMMPTMSGMDFFDALQLIAPGEQRKIAFLTGGAFTARARAFVEAVDNAVLDKPCSGAALRTLVRAACSCSG